MSELTVFCDQCGQVLRVPESRIGQRGPCPGCGVRIEITETGAVAVDGPAAAPPAPEPVHPASPRRPTRTRPASRRGRSAPSAHRARAGGGSGMTKEIRLLLIGAVAVVIVVVLLMGGQKDRRPGRSGPSNPVVTTLGDVLAGRHESGTYVRVDAVVVPDVLIWAQGGGESYGVNRRYYVLAVAPDSSFTRLWREALVDLDRFERGRLPEIGKPTSDLEVVSAQLTEFSRVVERVTDLLEGRAWANAAVALRVADAHRFRETAEWETVVDTDPRRQYYERMRQFIVPTERDIKEAKWAAEEAREANRKLWEDHAYRQQAIAEELILTRWRLMRVSPDRKRDIVARVEPTDDLARTTYRKGVGLAPSAYVSEERLDGQGLARSLLGRLDVFVTTTPPGASLSVDGAWKGRTPYVVQDVPLRRRVKLELSLDSHYPKSETREFRASVEGIEQVEFVLHRK